MMKMKILTTIIALAIIAGCQGGSTVKNLPKPEQDQDRFSYAVGYDIGHKMRMDSAKVNLDYFFLGVSQGYNGKDSLMSGLEVQNTLDEMMKQRNELQQKQMEDYQKEFQQKAEINKTESVRFMAENKTKPGVITTASGLQYQIIQEGTGPHPSANDSVKVHYLGTFTDGKMFDDTRSRGSVDLNLGAVIPGMQEAMLLMKAGSKWKLWIPPELAYGERGAGYTIPGYAVLVYEIELISIAIKK